jgi:hypothetical protein
VKQLLETKSPRRKGSRGVRMDGPIRSKKKFGFFPQIIYDSKSPIPNIGENYIDLRLIGNLQAILGKFNWKTWLSVE